MTPAQRRDMCNDTGLRLSAQHHAPISGHEFVVAAEYPDSQVLVCTFCDTQSIGWRTHQFDAMERDA